MSRKIHAVEEHRFAICCDHARRVGGLGVPAGGLRGSEVIFEIVGDRHRDSHVERASGRSEEHLLGEGLQKSDRWRDQRQSFCF